MAGFGFSRRGGVSIAEVNAAVAAYLEENPVLIPDDGGGQPASTLTEAQVRTIIGAYLTQNPQGDGTGFNKNQVETIISDFLAANPPADDSGFTETEINGIIGSYLAANPQGDGTGFTEAEVIDIIKDNLEDVFPEDFNTPNIAWGNGPTGQRQWVPVPSQSQVLPDQSFASSGQVVAISSNPGSVYEAYDTSKPGWSLNSLTGQYDFTVTAGVNDDFTYRANNFFTTSVIIPPGTYDQSGLVNAINGVLMPNFYNISVFGFFGGNFNMYNITVPLEFIKNPNSFLAAIGIRDSFFGEQRGPQKSVQWTTLNFATEQTVRDLAPGAVVAQFPTLQYLPSLDGVVDGSTLKVEVTLGNLVLPVAMDNQYFTFDPVGGGYTYEIGFYNEQLALERADGSPMNIYLSAGTYTQEQLSTLVTNAMSGWGVKAKFRADFSNGQIEFYDIEETLRFSQMYGSQRWLDNMTLLVTLPSSASGGPGLVWAPPA